MSETRKWSAVSLILVTVAGLIVTLVGCILTKPVAIGVGMVMMALPFVGLIAYVCWDDLCRDHVDEGGLLVQME